MPFSLYLIIIINRNFNEPHAQFMYAYRNTSGEPSLESDTTMRV